MLIRLSDGEEFLDRARARKMKQTKRYRVRVRSDRYLLGVSTNQIEEQIADTIDSHRDLEVRVEEWSWTDIMIGVGGVLVFGFPLVVLVVWFVVKGIESL